MWSKLRWQRAPELRSRAIECPVPLGGERWAKGGQLGDDRKKIWRLERECQHVGEVDLGVICIRVKVDSVCYTFSMYTTIMAMLYICVKYYQEEEVNNKEGAPRQSSEAHLKWQRKVGMWENLHCLDWRGQVREDENGKWTRVSCHEEVICKFNKCCFCSVKRAEIRLIVILLWDTYLSTCWFLSKVRGTLEIGQILLNLVGSSFKILRDCTLTIHPKYFTTPLCRCVVVSLKSV